MKFEVRKKGPGGTALSKKSSAIARFVAKRINVRDIPAVRTAGSSLRMVDEMVQRALQSVEASEEYAEAVRKIAELQRPILDDIGSELRDMVQLFLPEVSDIRIDVEDRLGALRRSAKILVNDGTVTELSHKGDGVQSLAALALIHRVAMGQAGGRELVLAVEEPEAHLHPRAIHKLKAVLSDIASNQQVILTTHSPLFVNRTDITSNVIVDKSRARPARTIAEIRDTLGVKVSDSLSSAEVVLICEGECDRVSLTGLLPSRSPILADAFATGRLAVDGMQGGGNLKYKLALYRDQLCATHSLVDNDTSGIEAVRQATLEGLCQPSDVTYAICPGRQESEFEDLLRRSLYAESIKNHYNVDVAKLSAPQKRLKWSERMKAAFLASGQIWDDAVCRDVKTLVAQLVARSPADAIEPDLVGAIDGLVMALEAKLS